MSEHIEHPQERLELGDGARRVARIAAMAGVAGLLVSLGWSLSADHGPRRFYFAYLVSFAYVLSIALGGLFFTLLQHLTRAGWSVNVRRIAEAMGATMPWVALLSLPIVFSVVIQKGQLYRWAQPHPPAHAATSHETEHGAPAAGESQPAQKEGHGDGHGGVDELTIGKRPFLTWWFFLLASIACLGSWAWIGNWYWRQSVAQDRSGEVTLTRTMEKYSAPAMLLYALTVTAFALLWIMSLDPHWYSTMFGVYYFAGTAVACFATLVVICCLLQRRGLMGRSITTEHYHDLGKFLFGFVFFWGYIAFSQYMLIWYANIPETTAWFSRRGATSADDAGPLAAAWSTISLLLLFGHLLIPFAGLMSRHIKRRRRILMFWAVWMLVFHWLDLYWLIMPEYDGHLRLGVVEIAAAVGVIGLFAAALVRKMASASLRPLGDPRLDESLAFVNV